MLAAVHSTLTGVHQQFPETLTLSRQALELLPEAAVSWRCMAAINLGVTCAYIGEVHEAVEVLSYAMELSQEIGSAFAMLSAFWHLSSLQTAQLFLHAAENTCQQLEHATQMPGLQRFPTSGYVALLLGEIQMERNDLDAAERYLLESAEQMNPESFPLALLRAYIALSRLKTLQGDTEGLNIIGACRAAGTDEQAARARDCAFDRSGTPLAGAGQSGGCRRLGSGESAWDSTTSSVITAKLTTSCWRGLYIARGNRTDKALYLLERMVKQAEAQPTKWQPDPCAHFASRRLPCAQ